MKKLTAIQIKDLPLAELVRILEIRAADFDVLIGLRGKVCLTSGVESVCMNGAIVQINLATAALDDVMEDGAFRWAFNDEEEAA
jgi:hypothetical protein|tara:strand:- start:1678 stop:1929 length:252 start_codon:yes stop_codon:yes gene_type:complete